MSRPSIAVVGAGVVGLSVARSLSAAGAEVTIFERDRIGAGTSSGTFAWVNSNGKSPDSYYELNLAGMREHERLQRDSASEAHWYLQTGTYEWTTDPAVGERLQARVQRLTDLGYPIRKTTAEELRTRIPELRVHPRSSEIVHFPSEGYVVPSVLLARLWSEARANGARLRAPADVLDIAEDSTGVTLELSTGENWRGDFVVSAAGRWSESVMKVLGKQFAMIDPDQPNKFACGFLGRTDPQYVQLSSNLITPEMNVRPDGGGRLLLQTPDLDHRADPAYHADTTALIGEEMLRRLNRLFANTAGAKIEQIKVGQRARPADGLPAAGFVTEPARVYLVATHSGITLAPLLGKLISAELLEGARSPLLADYAPDRLIGKTINDFPKFATLHFPAAQ
ncbi:FAD-binding oxidoreductase [Amycolatopsis rubida]|uniref:FAD-binding oxidoreductase n=1 Tax=Amycolatopsis rubida TaxID=112413 RepID=A0A1I5SMQ5_9PSEU|nr:MULTISPECIES: FAD-dependent oxidoreductase [Amycolatopsis]MYW97412.1 FAD-dependent oxidoreductase [Amycolatopsis rubida]NEC62397.1 FAD-binding oxidoreductase [Amycolatopsis rubida]OAP20049.1 tRNA 5-methylaminomethyl-2-thiouridine biosynthesis bifunctional protein MnmC [Amycolatopsis sp. M39]SFP72032.1 Glycine/D-amino acid oxidase [Amycolatopsis rubida]